VWVYQFPKECEVRTEPVSRWKLALAISIAVLGICLWGTLMGCLIPLIISKFGGDPAVASGALVATLVDVTGIAIYFCAAWLILL
jgi:magnesium transporter